MAVNNFFDLVKDGFFNVLTSQSKRLNVDLLLILYKNMTLDKLVARREELVNWLYDYIINSPIILYDEGIEITDDKTKTIASDKIRMFTNYGWLVEDISGFNITYQLDEFAISILATIRDFIDNETYSLEFSGYVYNIYSLLKTFDYNRAVELTEQLSKSNKELINSLRGLNVNIRKFLTRLLKDNEATPREILKTIYEDYQNKVILKAFENFRTKDNPSRHKLEIINIIDNLLNPLNLGKMVNNYLILKCNNINNDDNIDEAINFFKIELNNIKNTFNEIEEYLIVLNKRNNNYLATAKNRINFLINEQNNIEGKINQALKHLVKFNEDFFENINFDLIETKNVDTMSLYTPRKQNPKIKSEVLVNINSFMFDEKKIKEEFYKSYEYSVNEIDKFALNLLKDNKMIYAKDIMIDNDKMLLKLFLLKIYSCNMLIHYKIKLLDSTYNYNNKKFQDFIIERI